MMDRVRRAFSGRGAVGAVAWIVRMVWRRVAALAVAGLLRARNRFTHSKVTGDVDAIVSLTSFGSRIETVYLTIESIARGAVRPERLILWLDDPDVLANPPSELCRLRQRGLEILPAEPLGSHKKYFPALDTAIAGGSARLITIDDDVLYPTWWLKKLVAATIETPSAVVAYRARRVTFADAGFAPWSQWPLCRSAEQSVLNMGIGEGGIAYPQKVLQALRSRGMGFLLSAPKADDLWLHSTAVSAGVPTRQVSHKPLHPLITPRSQATALASGNILGGGNDAVLPVVYSSPSMARLLAASREGSVE